MNLGINHVQVFVQGMSAVSRVDGVQPAETNLLRNFYDACQSEAHAMTGFDDLASQEFSPIHAREVLDTTELCTEFLRSCVFVGYADGKYTATERAKVAEFAADLKVEPGQLKEIEAQVADILMSQMATLQNIDAIREVARKTRPQQ